MKGNIEHYIKHKPKTTALLMAFVLSFIFLLIFYKPLVLNPNQHLFTNWGDGIKNYYTYTYHITHDSSYVYFEGMNYPYGELHQFTDGQPFLASIVKTIGKIIPGTENYAIGILNLFLLFSFVIASILLALILTEYRVPPLLSGLSAVAVMCLAPQIHRFGGHLSLGYFFAFPLAWYLLILYNKHRKWLFSLLLFLVNLSLLFTHPYLCVMNTAFILLFFICKFIASGRNNIWIQIIHLFVQAILPLIIWMLYINIFDSHSNRPENVISLDNLGQVAGILLPNSGFLKEFINTQLGYAYQPIWESWSYLGLFNLIVITGMICHLIITFIKKGILSLFPKNFPNIFKLYWLAAFLVLLYGLGLPYIAGFDFLLDWFPALKQIRVLYRFCWVFFYVSSLGSILVVYYAFVHNRHKQHIGYAILIIGILFTIIEGSQYHKSYKISYSQSDNIFSKKSQNDLAQAACTLSDTLDTEKFQAIIPLPYYHTGSGFYQIKKLDKPGFGESLVLSYHTGLPLMSVTLSRTSITETRHLLDIFSPPFVQKEVLHKMNEKPILVMVTNPDLVRLREKWLIEKAKLITKNQHFELYSLDVNDLSNFDYDLLRNEIKDYNNDLRSGNFVSTRGNDKFHFEGFTTKYPKAKLDTSIVKRSNMHGYNTLCELPADFFNKNKKYEMSFWYYNRGERLNTNMFINQADKEGTEDWTDFFSTMNGYYFGDWTMVTHDFTLKGDAEHLNFTIHYEPETDVKIYYTDFLIRQFDTDVYFRINDTLLFKNNQHLVIPDTFLND